MLLRMIEHPLLLSALIAWGTVFLLSVILNEHRPLYKRDRFLQLALVFLAGALFIGSLVVIFPRL